MARRRRSIKFGFLFWIFFILLIILLFFINKNNIKLVLSEVKLPNFFQKKTESPNTDLHVQIQNEIERINEEETASVLVSEPVKTSTEAKNPSPTTTKDASTNTASQTTTTPKKTTSSEKSSEPNTSKQDSSSSTNASDTKTATRNALVYFVSIDSDGKIIRVPVQRNLTASDSPMSDALNSLFSGVSKTEKKGVVSLIPSDTKLLSATVRDGIAYINVSESFEFNQYGIEGYLAELAQVVYTATEFSTVNAVQFLIEGQKKNYLGSDGVWIGTPLTRDLF